MLKSVTDNFASQIHPTWGLGSASWDCGVELLKTPYTATKKTSKLHTEKTDQALPTASLPTALKTESTNITKKDPDY